MKQKKKGAKPRSALMPLNLQLIRDEDPFEDVIPLLPPHLLSIQEEKVEYGSTHASGLN